MSYKILNDVSNSLRDLLSTEFANDASIHGIVGGAGGIGFKNPTDTALDTSIRLSLWLYQVVENEFLKNDPPVSTASSGLRRMTPLPLNLYYLVTPFASQRESDLLLLGKTMEVLYDNAILVVRDSVTLEEHELRVILCRMTLEELTRVWEALREPYRLSVCYQIRVTRIESRRELIDARVIERTAGLGQIELASVR